jgi:hypothetical protein
MLRDADLASLRLDLAERSKWNIGYFVAGGLLWLAIFAAGRLLPIDDARFVWIAATFFTLPIAIAASKILKADPFCSDNSLGNLVGYTHMSVIALSMPIVVMLCIIAPEAQLLAMAILYCIDFYVMSWAFGSKLFGLHAAVRTILVTGIWFAAPELRLTLLPLTVAALYLLTVLAMPGLRRKWLADHRLNLPNA